MTVLSVVAKHEVVEVTAFQRIGFQREVNAHLDAAATEAEIRRQRDVHRPVGAVLVEDKANGPAVVQRLRMNVHGVIEINPEGGKTARMFAAAPEWQAGDRYVDRNAAWTEPFIKQITTFPNGRYDDQADIDLGGGVAVAEGYSHCEFLDRPVVTPTRAQSVTSLIEVGRVFLPESAPWLNDFVDELAAFPRGMHDDCLSRRL